MMSILLRYLRYKTGSVAIETALLMPLILLIICACLEYSFIMSLSANVQSSAYFATRNTVTGNLYGTIQASNETNTQTRVRMITNTIHKKLAFYNKFLKNTNRDLIVYIQKINDSSRTTTNAQGKISPAFQVAMSNIDSCLNNLNACSSINTINDNQQGDTLLLIMVAFKWRYITPFAGLIGGNRDNYIWLTSVSAHMVE